MSEEKQYRVYVTVAVDLEAKSDGEARAAAVDAVKSCHPLDEYLWEDMTATVESCAEMQTERMIDKSSWPDGPWQYEYDVRRFITKSGLPAMVRRADLGHLCGYVGVSRSHPFFGQSPNEMGAVPDVHGGLNHGEQDEDDSELWWLGFDCSHLGDRSGFAVTALPMPVMTETGEYRTTEYVERECENLAAELLAMAGS